MIVKAWLPVFGRPVPTWNTRFPTLVLEPEQSYSCEPKICTSRMLSGVGDASVGSWCRLRLIELEAPRVVNRSPPVAEPGVPAPPPALSPASQMFTPSVVIAARTDVASYEL